VMTAIASDRSSLTTSFTNSLLEQTFLIEQRLY
jgi:hypothetical protein